jgi:ATP-binding cassette subfamily F protein uup
MALISLKDVCWGFGGPPLLENVSFQIEKGRRIALVGRNGVGKSTLMKILDGTLQPDSGDVWRQKGVRVAALPQDVPADITGTVFDVVANGCGRPHESVPPSQDNDAPTALAQRIDAALSRVGIDRSEPFAELSAGMKRRALFARALAQAPDILLLDEPTNHLDIITIEWMESFILRHVPTLVCVTHDRVFLTRVAAMVMSLDRGRLTVYDCGYADFAARRQADLAVEASRLRKEDKLLADEEAWIRQGIKARRTRNDGRVRALKKLRESVRSRRRRTGDVRLQIQEAERTGKLVIEATGVRIAWAHTTIVEDLSTVIMRGDRVGIIGPNGCGKTSLLRVLLKSLPPDDGAVRHGTRLQVAYFDQLRAQLDPEKTVAENISGGNAFIIFNGEKRHVIGYLKDFLFSPQRSRTPVHVLSGGRKTGCFWPSCLRLPPTCLSSMSPPTTWTPKHWTSWKNACFNSTGPCFWSATTERL